MATYLSLKNEHSLAPKKWWLPIGISFFSQGFYLQVRAVRFREGNSSNGSKWHMYTRGDSEYWSDIQGAKLLWWERWRVSFREGIPFSPLNLNRPRACVSGGISASNLGFQAIFCWFYHGKSPFFHHNFGQIQVFKKNLRWIRRVFLENSGPGISSVDFSGPPEILCVLDP